MTAITYYFANTQNEMAKLRRTFAFWLTLISALVIPLLFFIVYAVKHAELAPAEGVNPWTKFMANQVENSIPFFVPMFIVLITSLIIQVEHKATGLKQLFVQPVPKWSVYFGKLSVVLVTIVFTYVVFLTAIIGLGYLLGILFSELQFVNYQPHYLKYVKMLSLSFVASLGIVGIQFWMSFRFKNFIIPITVGMCLVITGLIVSQAPESIYFPYAYNVLSLSLGGQQPLLLGLSKVTVFSCACFILTAGVGYWDISKRNIK